MNSKHQPAVISATIFYYDIEYQEETACKVFDILDRYGMFPPEKYHADVLTNNRYILADKDARKLLVQAYSTKDVLGIDMSSGDSKTALDYWRVNWGLTYYKSSRLVGGCKFTPWNTITIQSTYGRLRDKKVHQEFIDCLKEIINVLAPFYASIDDVRNKVSLLNHARESFFVPERVQAIYWGNYFGAEHTKHYGLEEILSLPVYCSEQIGDGVFFLLTDSLHGFDSKEAITRRKQVNKALQIKA